MLHHVLYIALLSVDMYLAYRVGYMHADNKWLDRRLQQIRQGKRAN